MGEADTVQIPIEDESGIVTARKTGRDMARDMGFRAVDAAQLATAISELARNILLYANRGEISIALLSGSDSEQGIQVTAVDEGPGIEEIEVVMQDGYSTSDGLGLGLPGTRRIVDEFEISSTPGQGTLVRITKWLRR